MQANFSSRHSVVVFLSLSEARSSVEGLISARTVSSVAGSFTRLGSSVNVSEVTVVTSSPRCPLTPRGVRPEDMMKAVRSRSTLGLKNTILLMVLCSFHRVLWLLNVCLSPSLFHFGWGVR